MCRVLHGITEIPTKLILCIVIGYFPCFIDDENKMQKVRLVGQCQKSQGSHSGLDSWSKLLPCIQSPLDTETNKMAC